MRHFMSQYYSINAASVISPIALNRLMKKIRNPPTIPPNHRNGLAEMAVVVVPIVHMGRSPVNQIANAIAQNIATAKGISPRNMNNIDTFKACNILTK